MNKPSLLSTLFAVGLILLCGAAMTSALADEKPQEGASQEASRKRSEKSDASSEKPKQKVVYGKYNTLNRFENYVLLQKGTERRFTGKYTENKKQGTYICRRCNAALYNSSDKFESHCGWPSFDDEIKGAVKRQRDKDGVRVEIVCSNCDGHLGHVFFGERYTAKNTRHCVNSVSMKFIEKRKELPALVRSPAQKKKDELLKAKAEAAKRATATKDSPIKEGS